MEIKRDPSVDKAIEAILILSKALATYIEVMSTSIVILDDRNRGDSQP